MIVLVDHHLRGYIVLLQGTLSFEGWLDLMPIRFAMFEEVNLADDSSDRVVWRLAQDRRMLLLTANRNAKGNDSLEQTIREESTATSLPILTIGSIERLVEREYRERCSTRLVEIILYLDNYLGVGRLFIP